MAWRSRAVRGCTARAAPTTDDTASDDAVAIVMALQHPDVHVEALTVVAGNVGLDQAVQNALYTVELCGKETPVYAGRAQPIMRTLETAQSIHGHDGMGDCGLPLHGRTPTAGRGVDVIGILPADASGCRASQPVPRRRLEWAGPRRGSPSRPA